jgi:hypothetical protein
LLGLYQNKGLCEKHRPKSGKAHSQGGLLSGKAHFPKMFLKTILVVQRAYERNKMTRDISEMGMLAPSHVVCNELRVFMLCNTLSKYT